MLFESLRNILIKSQIIQHHLVPIKTLHRREFRALLWEVFMSGGDPKDQTEQESRAHPQIFVLSGR